MEDMMNMYMHRCIAFVEFMLSHQQWTGVTRPNVTQWLRNFDDLEIHQKLLVHKLLSRIIYFSEEDIINVLQEGIYNKIFSHLILQNQIENDFNLGKKAVQNIVNDELNKTCFVPLLDNDSPHESGNLMLRYLVQKCNLKAEQSVFLDNFVEATKKYEYNRLVIVDDCIGSGDQLRDFWDKNAFVTVDGNRILLKEFCTDRTIEVLYLVLFGYVESVNHAMGSFSELKIHCVKFLDDKQRVLHNDSYVWDNESEATEAIELISRICAEQGIELYGHNNMDFAFIMHQTIPDWSLPIFWRSRPEWRPLMRRKNSDG